MSGETAPAVLLAAAAIVSAALGLRAAILASEASSSWESSVRVEVRKGAGAVNDALLVFDEAPLAARTATTRFRAEEIRRELEQADPTISTELLAETTLLTALAESTAGGVNDAALDVEQRLEERRRGRTLAGEPSPSELDEDGDRAGRRAVLAAAAAIPAGFAFLLGAAAQGLPRRRRLLVAAGVVLLLASAAGGIALEVTGA